MTPESHLPSGHDAAPGRILTFCRKGTPISIRAVRVSAPRTLFSEPVTSTGTQALDPGVELRPETECTHELNPDTRKQPFAGEYLSVNMSLRRAAAVRPRNRPGIR